MSVQTKRARKFLIFPEVFFGGSLIWAKKICVFVYWRLRTILKWGGRKLQAFVSARLNR